jgi:hypothetical protein
MKGVVLGMEEAQNNFVNLERRRRKECSFNGCIKGSALVPGPIIAKFRSKKRVSPSVVDPWHHRVAPRGGGSCLSAGPAVVGTPHGPS